MIPTTVTANSSTTSKTPDPMANQNKHTSPHSVTTMALPNASSYASNPLVTNAMAGATNKTLLSATASSSATTTATMHSSTSKSLATSCSLQVPNPVSFLQPTPVKEVPRETATTAMSQSVLSNIRPPEPLKHLPTPPSSQASSSVAAPVVVAIPNSSTNTVYHRLPTNTNNNPSSSILTSNLQPASSSPPSTKNSSKKQKNSISLNTSLSVSSSGSVQGENTGRWTAEEHRLFLQGLEQHGKGWKKIASLIKSRTVVQIRTHAQKYFQKIAKARQNGEDGEVSMENRENGNASSSSASKRKRSGNKRKAIASVVASAVVEGKKQATDKTKKLASALGTADDVIPLDFVAPALTPYLHHVSFTNSEIDELTEGQVTPIECTTSQRHCNNVPSAITSNHGTISGAVLEDSLFRFLTPMPNESQVNGVARQAGANPITVPNNVSKISQSQYDEGEISPTGVVDFPSNWAWSEEPPSWYAKGADVDELLNEADALDWLADSGDLNETYNPPPQDHSKMSEPSLMSLVDADDIKMEKTFPTADTVPIPIFESSTNLTTSASSSNMPAFTSMFGSVNNLSNMKKVQSTNLSSVSLFASATEAVDAVVDEENFKLLDEQFDEQAFVTALLDHSGDSAHNLNHLDQ